MDIVKWVPVMAVALLAASCQWAIPPLPSPSAAADSAQQVAERLNGHLAEPPALPERGVRGLDIALAPECHIDEGTEGPLPPKGVPGYTAQLRVAQIGTPIGVRIWLTSPGEARRLTDAVRQAAARCRPDYAQPFARRGWNGMEVLLTVPTSSDNGDPVTFGTVVAGHGGLLAEVSYWWPAEYGDLDRVRQAQGAAAAEAVLAAVGGDPSGSGALWPREPFPPPGGRRRARGLRGRSG
ncbi:hypothetical protein [Microbispora sp. NPDC049125]|uniref:hypothetical protein n=1 Tax=Microbispora sp. NPDC049125 TaxID=3154929 RepID=UPI003467A4DD